MDIWAKGTVSQSGDQDKMGQIVHYVLARWTIAQNGHYIGQKGHQDKMDNRTKWTTGQDGQLHKMDTWAKWTLG